jgi:sarcosine oxidase
MEHLRCRNVVVGAGAMGSAAAYQLARRGEPVLLVEQFALGHDRGSSHGSARITRHSYADAHYARLMPEAFRAWRVLEADAGENLYLRTGGVSLCPPGVDYVGRVAASLAAIDVPHRRMTGRELCRAYPVFQVAGETDVVFEPDAGMIAAARSLAVEVALARELGGDRTRVLERCPVRRIDLDGASPTVLTDAYRITADRLILTAGAWTRRLVPRFSAPLRPTRQRVLYLRPADPARFEPGRFPVFISMGTAEGEHLYGMPAFLGMGIKSARHGGPDLEADPDLDDRIVGDDESDVVRRLLRDRIPALAEAEIEAAETCLYTVAPDEQFCLDVLPGRPDVIVASPCSGHGFKFSCLIGRILAELAIDGQTSVDIRPWRLPERNSPGAPIDSGISRGQGL